jgi:hypothetical protein
MPEISDERISSYLDGEAGPERAALEAALRDDPALALRAQTLRQNDRVLREAVDEALGPTPQPLLAGLRAAGAPSNVVAFPSWPSARVRRAGWAVPIAAALAAGLFIGRAFEPEVQPALVATSGAGMVAGAQLAGVLSSARSGETHRLANGTVQVALSFQSNQGALCRQFEATADGNAGSGVACRSGGTWRIEDWTADGGAAQEGYRTAAGPDDPVMASELARLGVARVLDRADEARAIAQKWPARPQR